MFIRASVLKLGRSWSIQNKMGLVRPFSWKMALDEDVFADRNHSFLKSGGASKPPPSLKADVKCEVENSSEKSHLIKGKAFSDMDLSPNTLRALTETMQFNYMTRVQDESLPEILNGNDVLVKAKTGTGKTIGFLVPAIEILLKEKILLKKSKTAVPPGRILILSPTRELAQQIATEANSLCTFNGLGTTLLVGGTKMPADVRALSRPPSGSSDILVATPGRLVAHLKETPGFADQLKGVKVFVLDEADRLLDMGFKKDIDDITKALNHRNTGLVGGRQTLLFSATVSREIETIAANTLQPGYKFIDTVGEEEEQTHAHVPQQVVKVSMDQQMRAIVNILEEQKQLSPDYKMILFFPTARQTEYYATILNSIGLNVLDIHSRMSQAQRTRTSEQFRAGKNLILLSSDVSARGMDYPGVTFVLQVGMTDRDSYIHRLGRTARAGKEGRGMLLLSHFEYSSMMNELKDMPLEEIDLSLKYSSDLMTKAALALSAINDKDVAYATATDAFKIENEDLASAKLAWAAWLGYYNGMNKKLGIDKPELVRLSVQYANSIGLNCIPALPRNTLGKMGLVSVPGLRIEEKSSSGGSGGSGGRGGGRRGGRGSGRNASPQSSSTVNSSSSSSNSSAAKSRDSSNSGGRGGGRSGNSSGGRGSGGRGGVRGKMSGPSSNSGAWYE